MGTWIVVAILILGLSSLVLFAFGPYITDGGYDPILPKAYAGNLTSGLPVASVGSMNFRGPFSIAVIVDEGFVRLWASVNGERVHESRASNVTLRHPFERTNGAALSLDVLLALEAGDDLASVEVRFTTHVSTPVYRSGNLALVDPRGDWPPVPFEIVRDAPPHVAPVQRLVDWEFDFPNQAT